MVNGTDFRVSHQRSFASGTVLLAMLGPLGVREIVLRHTTSHHLSLNSV